MGARVLAVFGDVGRNPGRTLLLSHLCPYLSGLAPAAAGLAGITFARFLVYDSMGVLLGTTWFLGLGAFIGSGSLAFAQGIVAGVGLTVLAVILCLLLLRITRASRRRRGVAFMAFSVVEYPIFLIQGAAYRFLPMGKRARLEARRNLIMTVAQPGDIFLVTRNEAGPWGKSSHSGIFETADTVFHAFHRTQRQKFTDLPLRDGFILLRVALSPEQREAVLSYARRHIGKKFKISTTLAHVRRPNPRHFSCAAFVWASFYSAGIDLAAHLNQADRWVFPRDFQSSPLTAEVPIPDSGLPGDPSSDFAAFVEPDSARR